MATPVITYAAIQSRDLDANRLAVELPKDLLLESTRLSMEEHNAEMKIVAGLFSTPTLSRESTLNEWADVEMQPMDEVGEPQPIKGRTPVDLAFPIDDMSIRFDLTFKAKNQITAQEYSDTIAQIQAADANTMSRKIMASLFSNVAVAHREKGHSEQTVKFLANNDTDTYALQAGGASTANHYGAQAAAISDAANPYTTIESNLADRRINTAPYVAFIPPGLVATTRLLDGFASTGFGDVAVSNPAIATTVLQATLASQGVVLPSNMLEIGGIGQLHIVQYNRLPAGYILYAALGDPMRRPLRMRQYPQAALQGLVAVEETLEFPYFKNRFDRYYGFGGYNRVGAGVYYIGNAAYAVPAALANPFGR